MGTGTSTPITAKASGGGDSPERGLAWGYSAMQGWRPTMEDAFLATPAIDDDGWSGTAAFGVMDGHGGDRVARFCERHLLEEVSKGNHQDVSAALVDAFHRMDELLGDRHLIEEDAHCAGCTANLCCVLQNVIVCANAGDSRAVLCRGGRAIPLSQDHKPNNPEERTRIKKAGGRVIQFPANVYRVNGKLNLSRSIGDLRYKQNPGLTPDEQMISATPDVRVEPRQQQDEFLVIACDGIWDVMRNQEVVDFIRQRLNDNAELEETEADESASRLSRICEDLLDQCLSPDLDQTHGYGGDNMTVVLVTLGPPAARPLTEAAPRGRRPAPRLLPSPGDGAWRGRPSPEITPRVLQCAPGHGDFHVKGFRGGGAFTFSPSHSHVPPPCPPHSQSALCPPHPPPSFRRLQRV